MTLAGFLPTLEKHIRINPNITTMLRVELESMFASLDQLRRATVKYAGRRRRLEVGVAFGVGDAAGAGVDGRQRSLRRRM